MAYEALGRTSPEELTGRRENPGRVGSDGTQRALAGGTAAIIFDAILNRVPAVIPSANEQLPGLQAIISKALEKDCDLRYQSTSELLADLCLVPGCIAIDTNRAIRDSLLVVHLGCFLRAQQPLATTFVVYEDGLHS